MSAQVYPSQSLGTPSPSYHQLPDDPNPFSSVHRLSDASSARGLDADGMSIMTAPPPYSDSTTFIPTVQMQIETTGKPLLSFPIPLRPDPIPVYTLDTTGGTSSSPASLTPTYISLRPTRGSGSCFLVNPSLPTSDPDVHVPLSTTHYRFGPGRHPRVRLYTPGTATPTTNPFLSLPADECTADENNIDLSTWDSFELLSVGLLTRAITFRTRLGTFAWRYASRKERKAVNASSLLILDRVVKVAHAQNLAPRQKDEEVRTPVAHFVRNDEFRTEGSSSSSAGNGGRLLIDLRIWSDEEGGGKTEREMAVVMVVTTCLAMLKKEVDRRRAQQIAIMAGATSGGS